MGEATDHVGKVVNELNSRIDAQDVKIEQLANMVNDLVGKVENQANEIKGLKRNREEHRRVINNLTAKLITVEEGLEDVQKKVFPKVREWGSCPPSVVVDSLPLQTPVTLLNQQTSPPSKQMVASIICGQHAT